jgi:adenylylsulfate kinase-like enzyme
MNNYLYRHKDCFCNEAGKVVWITGLSGSGKSTVAQELWMLLKNNGVPSILLDGDELRNVFGEQDNYEIQQRLKISKKYSRLCKLLSEQGFNVVIGTISMFHEVQNWNRQNIEGYHEVYLKVHTSELKRRDPKGLYVDFESGEIQKIVGMDLPFEEPICPDQIFEFVPHSTPAQIANEIISKIAI